MEDTGVNSVEPTGNEEVLRLCCDAVGPVENGNVIGAGSNLLRITTLENSLERELTFAAFA